jgi:hypothetical protein
VDDVMKDGFAIHAAPVATFDGDPAAARIQISIGCHNSFRAENRWSNSVEDAPYLSAFPLALWLAGAWWRLRWEGEPPNRQRSLDWFMSHEVPAAGHGFLWPRLTFLSDGDTIIAECRPTPPDSEEMVRYLEHFDASVSATAFEFGVDLFMGQVIGRLGAWKDGKQLDTLWREVQRERNDPGLAAHRRIEALMGFDPDEAPAGLVDRLRTREAEAGSEALAEIAAGCWGPGASGLINAAFELAAGPRVPGRLWTAPQDIPLQSEGQPHERGAILARQVRKRLKLQPEQAMPSNTLAGLLGMTEARLHDSPSSEPKNQRAGLSLAIASDSFSEVEFMFRRRHPHGRRFEAARLVADLLARPHEAWHPATDAFSARQKLQRAFGAELLAPIQGLQAFLDGNFSVSAVQDAADHFNVSEQTVGSQLANNKLIPRSHESVPA